MAETTFPDEIEEQKALQKRLARKAAKQKRAAARELFLQMREGYADHTALRESLALLSQDSGIESDTLAAESTDTTSDVSPRAHSAPATLAFPANNLNRWVPIGPSAVRRGQGDGRPRVSGRIRDLAVSPNGQRAYAATAKGGVWFTQDGGATWEPLGGWANEPRTRGGNITSFASGCLLVSFGASAANDFVMVGTGEIGAGQSPANWAPMGGMGVLVANAPSTQAVQADPWETTTGIGVLEGLTIVRMVRVPGGPGAGQNGDRVIAATSGGLFMGTRSMIGGALGFNWAPIAAPAVAPPAPTQPGGVQDPTDLAYVGNRLFVCYRSNGVAFSDTNGASFNWVTINLNAGLPAATVLIGRMSIAVNEDNNTVYVLGEANTTPAAANPSPVAHVWQIANPGVAAPATPTATTLGNVPTSAQLWPGQRDYDQAIEVITFTPPAPPPARRDRIYIGGSLVGGAAVPAMTNWNASIWAFDVIGGALVAAVGVSDQPGTHGADLPGLIGNGIHPDVHVLRKATNTDGSRQIWVGCDGGVFASLRNGQTNTFASRNDGLASIEAGFVATHPTSSHFAMLGCQDNGRQVRVGDSVWELKTTMQGDGGGVLIHPVRSHYVLGQFILGVWACDPSSRYTQPVIGPTNTDPEHLASFGYSGISATVVTATNQVRIALGTNRVWLTDNLGTANPNTWNVLPITPGPPPIAPVAERDPRPGARGPSNAVNQAFGVPAAPALGAVVTVKWLNSTTLVALYQQGIIQYQESALNSGLWTTTTLLAPGMAAPAAPLVLPPVAGTFFTDIEPVPGTTDFYLTCTGQIAVVAVETCFFYDSAANGFRATGLGQRLPPVGAGSPNDPAYSVVVDPASPNTVYVGTVTGVWQSTRGAAPNFAHTPWNTFNNGLPESVVQDLKIWQGPAGSPRLLRAATQSRGVWELNLAAQEPARTYLRAHNFDDRRLFPTPLKNPRRSSTAPDMSVLRSPDITIRPEAPVTNTPSFRGTNISNGNLRYQLWTFQTAFRWLYPSIIPNGQWTDQFADIVERHRRLLAAADPTFPSPGGRFIDRRLWDAVMAAAQDAGANPGVYHAPWQNALVPNLPGTEIDLMETIVPRRDVNNVWQVYRERSTVDVLLHHRDTRPVAANNSFVVLLWRNSRSTNTLINTDCTNVIPYVRSLFGGAAQPVPAGWTVQLAGDGTPLHRLSVPLAARMPRAVSINLDLSAVPAGHRVMLLAISGSTADQFSAVPTAGQALDRVDRFVRNWPHAAARLISCWTRPGTQLF